MALKKSCVSTEAISKRLRRANTSTTEKFYARIEDEDADAACVNALEVLAP